MAESKKEKMTAKGRTNNPNGRPKGIPNKVTGVARERLLEMFDKLANRIESEYILDDKKFKELDPRVLFKLFADIIPYIIPQAKPDSDDNGQDKLTQTLTAIREVLNPKQN